MESAKSFFLKVVDEFASLEDALSEAHEENYHLEHEYLKLEKKFKDFETESTLCRDSLTKAFIQCLSIQITKKDIELILSDGEAEGEQVDFYKLGQLAVKILSHYANQEIIKKVDAATSTQIRKEKIL